MKDIYDERKVPQLRGYLIGQGLKTYEEQGEYLADKLGIVSVRAHNEKTPEEILSELILIGIKQAQVSKKKTPLQKLMLPQ